MFEQANLSLAAAFFTEEMVPNQNRGRAGVE